MRLRQTRDAAVRTAAIVVMALAAVGATSVPARAGAIAVTTTSDEAGSGPACSLREAILSANGDSAVGGCAAGSSTATDVISLPPGDYALAAGGTNEDAAADGDLDVTGNVDIEGAGADVTVVDGNGSVGGERVFQVFAPAVVTIRGVTIRDGHGGSGGGLSNLGGTVHLLHSAVTGNVGGNGGGLLNQSGTLDVVDSVVDGNVAKNGGGGGIGSFGGATLSITRSTVSGNEAFLGLGGGIDSVGGTATLTDSTVSGNDAVGDLGGGIFNGMNDVLTIVRSTFSGNHAGTSGGGILHNGGTLSMSGSTVSGNVADGDAGGIGIGQSATIVDSTISGNTAQGSGGGVHVLGGSPVLLANVTVTGNRADRDGNGSGDGGGVFRGAGNVTLVNTIVAGNLDAGGEAPDCSGDLGSQGFNLIGANTACLAAPGTGDQVGTPAAPIDAALGPLADNGGPTATRALLPGSPATGAGNPLAPGSGGSACAAFDQRGAPRSDCDVGAYQRVLCFGRPVTVVGSAAGDTLRGTNATEVFLALGGDDLIQAGAGSDRVCAGPGADRVMGEGGDDQLAGGPGSDSLDGGSGTDRCDGGPGSDTAVRCEQRNGI